MGKISVKLCALFIVLSTLICAFASCSGGDNSSGSISDTAASTDTAPAESTEAVTTYEEADIPEGTDFGGEEFRILYPNWSLYNNYYFADESTGDVMNDAIYKRTTEIEEKINIDITTFCPGIITEIVPAVSKAVLAGDDIYNLCIS